MSELQDFINSLGLQIAAFSAGIAAGFGVFAGEMTIFLGDVVMNAFRTSFPATAASNSAYTTYTTAITIFIIAGVIQGILIGRYSPETFSVGYIIGVFFLILFIGKILWGIAPSVVIGMIVAMISVAFGIMFRNSGSKRRNNYPPYDYWD